MGVKPPAFQFYPDDFLGGTVHFTDAEVGLYIRLLCIQWTTGKLPCENHELSSYGKGDTKVDRVLVKFEVCADGFLRNKRLELERLKQEQYRKSRSDNGKQGGRPRKPHGLSSLSKTKAKKSSPSPSPPLGGGRGEEVFDEWNKIQGTTHSLLISTKRRAALEARLKEPFFVANWKSAMVKVSKSPFCLGQGDRGWIATFDWFIKPDSVVRIMEGKYDGTPRSQAGKPNPRNFGIVRGTTNYSTAKPRLQREREAAQAARMAGQVAAPANNPPAVSGG